MSTKIYRVGDKVLVDELYGTGSTVVTIDRVFFYGDQETVRTYSAGKRQFLPSEIHGPANETRANEPEHDDVNHPSHYTAYPGIEVIQLTEHMNFCLGNAVKYCARAGLKDPSKTIEDLKKAVWYIEREISRLEQA